jgi:hypothetical protein
VGGVECEDIQWEEAVRLRKRVEGNSLKPDSAQFVSDFLVEVMAVSNYSDGFLDDVRMVKVGLLHLESY